MTEVAERMAEMKGAKAELITQLKKKDRLIERKERKLNDLIKENAELTKDMVS